MNHEAAASDQFESGINAPCPTCGFPPNGRRFPRQREGPCPECGHAIDWERVADRLCNERDKLRDADHAAIRAEQDKVIAEQREVIEAMSAQYGVMAERESGIPKGGTNASNNG